jgi:hypothetical protein
MYILANGAKRRLESEDKKYTATWIKYNDICEQLKKDFILVKNNEFREKYDNNDMSTGFSSGDDD